MRSPNDTDNFWIHEWVQKKGRGYIILITPNRIEVTIENYASERSETFDDIESAFDWMESLRSTSDKVPRKVQRKLRAGINDQMRSIDFNGSKAAFRAALADRLQYLARLEEYLSNQDKLYEDSERNQYNDS